MVQVIRNGVWHIGDTFDVMRTLPDASVDMVLCDLPYGTTQNKWDSVLPLDQLWKEYWRICKPTAAIILTASQPFTSSLVMSQPKMFRHEWIWIKNRGSNFLNAKREPLKEHESILTFSKGKWNYNGQLQERALGSRSLIGKIPKHGKVSENYGSYELVGKVLPELRVPSSWQKFNTQTKPIHPTQKPVALFEYLIRTYTNESDTVLDNTAGSGTTAVAAENTNRKWICIERDEEYSRKAIERINALPLL